MSTTPTVAPWLWASVFGATLTATLGPAPLVRQQREARFAALPRAARAAPLYRERLRDARVETLDQLPALAPVDKVELMRRFDDWATDRAVTREAVERFLRRAHAADAFLDRYLVWTSSGTSGEPGIFVQDARAMAVKVRAAVK